MSRPAQLARLQAQARQRAAVKPDRLSELMERYASGDEAVFEQLYHLLAPRLYRFCVRLARAAAEADDIFQETFLKLHRARATYLSGANPIPWAFAIARSVYLSRMRYRRRHRDEVGATCDIAEGDGPGPSASTPEGEILAEHMLDVVTDELSRMSEKNRIAYVLLKEENLSVKDAAAILGTNCDVVKQRAHRAYAQLKAALDAAGWREYGSCAT